MGNAGEFDSLRRKLGSDGEFFGRFLWERRIRLKRL